MSDKFCHLWIYCQKVRIRREERTCDAEQKLSMLIKKIKVVGCKIGLR